jgi:DNA-directed RNA polymerase subunit omega
LEVEVTNTKETNDSKFRMILLAAKRARQIQSGAKPLIHTVARKPTRVAQDEIKAGALPYEVLQTESPEVDEKEAAPTPAPKAKK